LSEWLKVIILGVVEGLTEFLPISSTGHLIVLSTLLDFHERLRVTFDICIQIGAVVAVLAFYHDDLLWQVRNLRRPGVRRLWLGLVLAFIPFAAVGMLTREWIKHTLFSPAVVAVSLIVGGVILLLVESARRDAPPPKPDSKNATPVTLRQAIVVGLAQLAALIPGVSRSAASIVGGMASGMSRTAATEFSFLLAIPTLGGATTVELLGSLSSIQPGDIAYLLVGSVISAVVAWVAVRWLLRYVSRHSFVPFGYYRIVAGVAILLLIFAQVLPGGLG
jgi:undecaprenyl-diphosphatase